MKRLLVLCLIFAWGIIPCSAAEPIQLARMSPAIVGGGVAAAAGITYDATSQGYSATGPLTISHINAGNFLFVGVSTYADTGIITGVTYNGVALTKIWDGDYGDSKNTSGWILGEGDGGSDAAPATGTHDIVVTASASKRIFARGLSYSGVNTTTPIGAVPSVVLASGTGAQTLSVTVASSVGDVIVDMVSSDSGAIAAGAGQEAHDVVDTSYLISGSSDKAGAATSTAMSWTNVTGGGATCGVAIKP